ncbi:MAG: fibrillarin-like rRNA/tRNA 2'-O-methyltransferase [Nanohaloarchaea archaeon]|nr:fibrillarin-like rRNA/tRNA 2'-O-methyltransferase [Candidatus Nanohaloarchaea archaeon]
MKEVQPGIYRKDGKLYTKAASDKKVYGEQHIEFEGETFREWVPGRSKAGAAVMKEVELGLEKDSEVLYLGAASGTTVSHFSDILEKGFVVGVEYSDTVIRQLVELAEHRENIAPVLGDARKPEEYEDMVGAVDVVFQDISQRDQPEIFLKNCRKFLKNGGTALLAVKARSMSSSKTKGEIFEEVKDKVREELDIVEETELDPYEKEHLFLKMKK